jgi:hypothetical protein
MLDSQYLKREPKSPRLILCYRTLVERFTMPQFRSLLRWLGTVAMLACCLNTPAFGQSGKKVPTPEAKSKAESLIQELYKEDFAKAQKDPASKVRLAITLLKEGKDTADDPAGRYVLYQHALNLATQAGDAPTALQAIEEIAMEYSLPTAEVIQMKIKALTVASKSVSTPDAYQNVVDSALLMLDDALAADEFPAAHELLITAENVGRKLKNVALVASIRKRGEEVARLENEFARWRPYADRLAKNPKDAQANMEMGKYQAFLKGNWERGLPLLARGTGPLQELAALDLVDPKQPAQLMRLGQGFLDEAQNLKGPMQINVLLRSYYWYQQALADGGTPSKTRAQVEKQMREIMQRVPAEWRVGEIAVELKRSEGHLGAVYSADFSPDGRKAISASADGTLRLWDTKTGKELKRLDGHTGRVWAVAFAPDGRRAASGGFDHSIRLWDLASGREIQRFSGHTDYVRSVAFSHDGHRLLSGGDDRTVRLWNVDTGKEIRSFPGHNYFVWSVALSRDGQRALSASLDKTIRLWDVETGSQLKKLEGHKDTVLSVVFSPDGRRALSGSTDNTLKLWDLESGQDMQTFTGHKGYVHSVAFAPDGRRALSASQDHTLRLWDARNGKDLRTLEGNRDQVWFVTFSRDGRLALSAGQDQTVRIWGGAK